MVSVFELLSKNKILSSIGDPVDHSLLHFLWNLVKELSGEIQLHH